MPERMVTGTSGEQRDSWTTVGPRFPPGPIPCHCSGNLHFSQLLSLGMMNKQIKTDKLT